MSSVRLSYLYWIATTRFGLSLRQEKVASHDTLIDLSCLDGRNGRFIDPSGQALRQINSEWMGRKRKRKAKFRCCVSLQRKYISTAFWSDRFTQCYYFHCYHYYPCCHYHYYQHIQYCHYYYHLIINAIHVFYALQLNGITWAYLTITIKHMNICLLIPRLKSWLYLRNFNTKSPLRTSCHLSCKITTPPELHRKTKIDYDFRISLVNSCVNVMTFNVVQSWVTSRIILIYGLHVWNKFHQFLNLSHVASR